MAFMHYDGQLFSPDEVDTHLSRYVKVPYCIPVSLSEPIAENGHGTVTVNGTPVSIGGEIYDGDMKFLMIHVGEVFREYGSECVVSLSGFVSCSGEKFEPYSFTLKTEKRRVQDIAYEEHDMKALEAAREGIVLLKNDDDVLPLKADSVLNCFGAGQHAYRITSTGASFINPRWRPNFIQSLAEHSSFTLNKELSDLYQTLKDIAPDEKMLIAAKEKSDTAIIFISRHSGEMQDNRPIKGQYYLSDDEENMIAAITKVFSKAVAVLNVGHPIDMRWIKKYDIKGVIFPGFAGMLSAYALVEILDGRTCPSGHLPFTISWDLPDNPVSSNFPTLADGEAFPGEAGRGVQIYYEEDIYMGYRYFDTFKKDAAFLFGHGLSYTEFSQVCESFERLENGVKIVLKVTNTGKCAGKYVAQVYIGAPDGKLEKPSNVLAAFDKTPILSPGESVTMSLIAYDRDFASFDEHSAAYILEKGEYIVRAGDGLDKLSVAGTFTLDEDITVKKVKHLGLPTESFKRLCKNDTAVETGRSKYVDIDKRINVPAERTSYEPDELPEYSGDLITWQELKNDESLLDSFVAQMDNDELCTLNVCAGNHFRSWDGGAGFTPDMPKFGMKSMEVTDANAGIHFMKPNIGFPASSVIAATFNKEIAYAVGRVVGEECRENNMPINLGPGMNLQRAPLNGRHPEYFSEDPFLAGVMAGNHGKGLEENVGCCYKHMFCNNSETARKTSHSIVSERALRELYFKAFEIAFSVHEPSTVMTSYNALNGIYPAEDASLLQGLLRDEWGFNGFIMCDWFSYDSIDMVEMVKAGNCWICDGGPAVLKQLKDAVKQGRVSRAVLQNNVRYLVKGFLKWSRD